MTAKQIDILKFISTIHRAEMARRSAIEWSAFISTLTVLVLFAYSVHEDKLHIAESGNWIGVVYAAPLAVATLTIFYLKSMHRANGVNKRFAEHAEDVLMGRKFVDGLCKSGALFSDLGCVKCGDKTCCGTNWSLLWQVLLLLLFAALSTWLVIRSPGEVNMNKPAVSSYDFRSR